MKENHLTLFLKITAISFFIITNNLTAQSLQFNIHNGLNIPMVRFKSIDHKLKYTTSLLNDTRIGLGYKLKNNISFGLNVGYQNIKAMHYDKYYQTSFENGYMIMEFNAGKTIKSKIIDKIMLAPSLMKYIHGSQTFNNFNVDSDDGFNKYTFLIGTQLNIKGITTDKAQFNPYINFRYMASNADNNSEDKLRIHNLLLGIAININYEK